MNSKNSYAEHVIDQKAKDFIKSSRDLRIPDTQIIETLSKTGINRNEIEDYLNPQSIETPNKYFYSSQSHLWDAFEHILLFISLLVMSTSLTMALHTFIDRWIPGMNGRDYDYDFISSWNLTLLRIYISGLIVSIPFFFFLYNKITKQTGLHPELRLLKTRKSLIYTTLVITFIIVLSNLIILVFNLLNGNVSLNFVMHFLVTVLISGIVFAYYLDEVKDDRAPKI